jgi:hypothetical protein
MRLVLAAAALMIGMAVAAALAASSSWHRQTRQQIAALAPSPPPLEAFDAAALDDVPAPVARYLRDAITDGHPIVRAAIATQEAEFFINDNWRPLTAQQHFSISPPGFVWDARIAMAPLIPVLVRDAYVHQRAMMQASMFGAYPLADQADNPQLNAGALQRWLGEAVWFPTALLPSSTVSWTAGDERSATVRLTDGPNRVSLLFEFGDNGLPRTISGDRFKEDQGRYAVAPWKISCGEHAVRDGLTIPLRCEVAWIVNGVPQPYWRGRISTIEYRYDVME